MKTEEMLLTILAEECVETAQRVSKAIRFGLSEVQEGQELTNADRIVYEFNDIYAMMIILAERDLIPPKIRDLGMIEEKIKKVDKYLSYSKELGTLKD